MFLVPESPRWLAKNGRSEQARGVLARDRRRRLCRRRPCAEIEATLVNEVKKVHFRELLDPKMRKVLCPGRRAGGVAAVVRHQRHLQLRGGNLRAAGYDISDMLMNIAWTGSVNLAFTFVALGIVDRGGRRPLMLFGVAGLAVIYIAMGCCYQGGRQGLPMLLLVLAAIGCYAMSLAPVTWVIISEIFPNRIRGAAMSVAVIGVVDRLLSSSPTPSRC